MNNSDRHAVVCDTLDSDPRIVRERDMNPHSHIVLGIGTRMACTQIVEETAHPIFSLAAYIAWQAGAKGRVYLGTDLVAGTSVSVTVMATTKAEAMRVLFDRDPHPHLQARTRFAKEFRPSVHPVVIGAAAKYPGIPLYASAVGGLDFIGFSERQGVIKKSRSSFAPRASTSPSNARAADRFQLLRAPCDL
jgi:hypothetical protein